MIDVSFHRNQSDCDFANSPLLVVLNISANFATSVLVLAHSTHGFNNSDTETENTSANDHVKVA